MTRTQRMEPVQKVMDERERQHVQRMNAAQTRVSAAEAKLEELRRYHMDYTHSFSRQAAAGSSGQALYDFQAFLGRLTEAIQQQTQILVRAREDLAAETHHWQTAARKSRALGVVVEQWRREEVKAVDRREQQETDERALRMPRLGLGEFQ